MRTYRLGILAGLLAGAFWGFSFLIPTLFPGVSPSELALGRFFWFGVCSCITLVSRREFKGSSPLFRIWKEASILSLSGYSLYYFLLVASVHWAGIPISSLIVGLIPVTVALMSRDELTKPKTFGVGAGSIMLGMAVLNRDAFDPKLWSSVANSHQGLGTLIAVVCLLLWSYFAMRNARVVKREPEMNSLEWSAVLGVYSMAWAVLIDLGGRVVHFDGESQSRVPFFSLKFMAFTAFLGVFSTFIATRLWNFASRVLPTGLVAQLIVSETLFALLYSFAYESRWPSGGEWLSMALIVIGVLLAIRAYQTSDGSSRG